MIAGKMFFLLGPVYYRTFAKSVIFMKNVCTIWYNPEITQATLYIPELYQQGILYLIDLTKNGDIMIRENTVLFYDISLDF